VEYVELEVMKVVLIRVIKETKLLSCDWKVTGSSPGNSLLCKNMVRLRTIHQMMGPLPRPYVCGSFKCIGLPFFYKGKKVINVVLKSEMTQLF